MAFAHQMIARLKTLIRVILMKKFVIRSYVPTPAGEILFQTELGGIRLCGDDLPRSDAWLLGYNFRAKSFCYADKIRVEGDRISNEVLISYGRSVFPVVNSSKPRVCLYYPENNRTFFLHYIRPESPC